MFVQKGRSMLFYTCSVVFPTVNVVYIIVEKQRVIEKFSSHIFITTFLKKLCEASSDRLRRCSYT